jgi:hypothetical protein
MSLNFFIYSLLVHFYLFISLPILFSYFFYLFISLSVLFSYVSYLVISLPILFSYISLSRYSISVLLSYVSCFVVSLSILFSYDSLCLYSLIYSHFHSRIALLYTFSVYLLIPLRTFLNFVCLFVWISVRA